MEMIPFSPPRIDEKITRAVEETLHSGWITTGPKTKLFEKRLAVFCAVPKVLALNSATAGLETMLRWFGVGEGDEVIVPAYTYAATGNVVLHCGAKVVFADAGPQFNVSIKEVAAKITTKTKVIMPVDLGGLPSDYDALMTLVQSDEVRSKFSPSTPEQKSLGRIMVLADAAHSLGATYKGKASGSLADASVFSFHAVKNLSTAEGGAVCLNLPAPFDNEELYKKLCISTLHGQTKDALAKTKVGNWRYDIVEAGYKCNMTDLQASIGLVELDRYRDDTLQKRRDIYKRYHKAFEKNDWAIVPKVSSDDGTESSYHVYMLRIKGVTEQQRDAIMQGIFERGVSVNVHFQPLPMFTLYKNMGYQVSDYPNAFEQYASEISLPVFYHLTEEQQQVVINAVQEAVQSVLG